MKVYADNAATTEVDKEVVKEMKKAFDSYGNPSSIHSYGHKARELVEEARERVAKEIGCEAEEVVFTSGGTEANNLALNILEEGDHLITSSIEHHSIHKLAEKYDVTFLKVDKDGVVDLKHLKDSIKENTKLVSIIHGNNEIGTVQDLCKIKEVCGDVLLHSDCVQSFKKETIPIDCLDVASISSHKIHGPKGVGALFVKKGVKIKPLLVGGAQENNLRAGTENVPGIVGFGKAASLKIDCDKIKKLRDYFISRVEKEIENVKLNGSRERLCNNANFSFKKIEGESILMALDLEGIMVSTGSACSSRSLEPSHVLLAIGLDHATAHGSIRFSFSKYNTLEEVDYIVDKLKKIVARLREVSAL